MHTSRAPSLRRNDHSFTPPTSHCRKEKPAFETTAPMDHDATRAPEWSWKTSRVRLGLQQILKSDRFEKCVLLLIIGNCVALGFESNRPGFDASIQALVLKILDRVFLSLFTIEMSLKILIFGWICEPDAYLRDGDFAIRELHRNGL